MYKIDPARLSAHATALTEDASSTATASTYAADHMTLEILDTSFVYSKAMFAANETVEALQSYFTALNTALTASATELEGTATRSLELDDAIEAELDREYPDAGTSPGPTTPAGDASSGSVHNAVDELTPPATEVPEDLVATILTTDWLSPLSALAQVLDWIFDWDYLDVIAKNFSGDWNKLYEVSDALKHLGAYTRVQGDNVRHEMAVTAGSWSGEAATAANVFFTDMADNLRDAGTKIAELGPEFEAVSRGMISTASLVSDVFAKILDAALVAAICIAAGTVSIETIVGGILGYLCGGIEIGYALWLAKSAYDTVQSVLTFFDALGAAVGVLGSLLAGGTDLPVPAGYDNAQVD
ncbi:hypothetical protein [Microbacterium sp.]|uniref:hypothetical protein n=1 Tax=Microbacterium sp. TaxID=51671 RepID=UPI0039E45724